MHRSVEPSNLAVPQKIQLLNTLRGLLRDVFRLRREGTAHARFTAAQGYADGFMRALLDAGLCSQQELLTLVAEVRRGVDGPALTGITVEPEETAVVAA